ncbi:MAG: helix-turn-helix domain-containing protein [Clostridia bacterium]|nr:helix-turn-helix domain-containing protein [Clostridia bacterium]
MYKEREKPKFWHMDAVPTPDRVGHAVVSPLHYGETAELLFTQGVTGTVTVNGHSFTLTPKTALFIPPRALHSCIFNEGDSRASEAIHAFHINLHKLCDFLDLKKMLQADHRSLSEIVPVQPQFDALWETVRGMEDQHRSFTARLGLLLHLFELMESASSKDRAEGIYDRHTIRIAEWIEEYYPRKITVEDAAKAFGYSKCYFCKWIREHTGTSFNELLNSTRINHAVSDLMAGFSVFETAERCGFSDPSYFTKVFKRIMGITPLTFLHKTKQELIPFH